MVKNTYKHPMILDLGYKKYKIIQEDMADEDAYGYTDLATDIIAIHPDQTPANYKGTLLHEILHVGYEFMGLGSDVLPKIGNEYLVTTTTGMLQLLEGLNKKLFKFIFS